VNQKIIHFYNALTGLLKNIFIILYSNYDILELLKLSQVTGNEGFIMSTVVFHKNQVDFSKTLIQLHGVRVSVFSQGAHVETFYLLPTNSKL
jgi:hypothetical protein